MEPKSLAVLSRRINSLPFELNLSHGTRTLRAFPPTWGKFWTTTKKFNQLQIWLAPSTLNSELKIGHWTQAPSIKPSQSSWSNNWSKARTYLICRVVKGPPAADGQVISQPQPEHSQSTCWHIFTKLVAQRDTNQNNERNSVRERIYWTPSMFSQRLSWRVVRDINSS